MRSAAPSARLIHSVLQLAACDCSAPSGEQAGGGGRRRGDAGGAGGGGQVRCLMHMQPRRPNRGSRRSHTGLPPTREVCGTQEAGGVQTSSEASHDLCAALGSARLLTWRPQRAPHLPSIAAPAQSQRCRHPQHSPSSRQPIGIPAAAPLPRSSAVVRCGPIRGRASSEGVSAPGARPGPAAARRLCRRLPLLTADRGRPAGGPAASECPLLDAAGPLWDSGAAGIQPWARGLTATLFDPSLPPRTASHGTFCPLATSN